MRIGGMIRRYVQESENLGMSSVEEVLGNIVLSEHEIHNPGQHQESIARKLANAKQVSIMELYESLIGSVRITAMEDQDWETTKALFFRGAQKTLMESKLEEAEVLSTTFQRLTTAKLFTTGMATYLLTPAVHEKLFGTFVSPYREFDHVVPSEAPEVENVKEGEPYGTASLADYWCKTRANKFGRIIAMTRETIIADKTGQVEMQAEGLARSAKYREDELGAKAWQDASNVSLIKDSADVDAGSYWPEGTQCALYRTAVGTTKAAYERDINKITSNNLLHWDSVAAVIRLMQSMQNRKGQYVNVFGSAGLTLVVPIGLTQRANLLTNAIHSDISANKTAGTEFMITRVPDPIRNMMGDQAPAQIRVIVWNLLPTESTASQSTWYVAGDSKQQFKKHQRWSTEFTRATPAQLGGDDFDKDVIAKFRAGFNAGFRAVDGKYVVQSTNS